MAWALEQISQGTPAVPAGMPQECQPAWQAFGSKTLPPDSRFAVKSWELVVVTGDDGLDNIRTVITSGKPLAYGTRLYTDFKSYDGSPVPYLGN